METPEDFICQLCQMIFDNPRDLTVHIRGHNEASSHTCNICSKKLSSASSLDRHMLIHSGERPFQCPMCEMSFTTNGNMNRHLRTHEKGSKEEQLQSNGDKIQDISDESIKPSHLSPSKRAEYESKRSQPLGMSPDNDMTCPVCHKTFICRIGFETHMTFHPDMTQNCVFCNLSFRNQRGLRMHLNKVHKKDAIGKSDVVFNPPQDGPSKNSSGIDELCIAEFSTTKFPHIAQRWCEENSLSMKGDGRTRVCVKCKKVFPCLSALNLHLLSAHGGTQSFQEKENMPIAKHKKHSKPDKTISGSGEDLSVDVPKSPKDSFMSALSLQPIEEWDSNRQRDGSLNLSHVTANKLGGTAETLWLSDNSKNTVHTDGLWKGFPIINFEHRGRKIAGRSGRPQPQSFSPLKAEMAGGAPRKPSIIDNRNRNKGSEEGNAGHGPLSRRRDAEPDTGDVGVGMLTPAEFASANSSVDEDELERERVMTEGSDGWDEDTSGKKYSHVCKFCSKAFPFRSTLKVHVRSHMGLTPYKCMLCDYSSADKSTLVRHMRTHSGERPYSCKLCGFPFTTKANCERHIKKRHGKLSKLDLDVNIQHHPLQRLPEQGQFSSPDTICKICNRDFKFFRDLQNHMRIHEKSPSKNYACVKCNMNFSKKNQCVRHMLRKHRHLSSSEIQQHVQSLSQKEEKAKMKRERDHNNHALNKSGSLQPLEEDLSAFKDLPFSSQADLSGLPRPVPVYVNTGYQEPFVDSVQEQPLDLSLPKDATSPPMLSPDRPATSHCSVTGGTPIIAESDNGGATRYKDPYRKFYSPRLDALVCPHCPRLFKKGSRLKTHIRSHTRERPFRCSLCSAAFTQNSSLDEHMIRRHCEEEEPDQDEIKYGLVTPIQMKLMHRGQPYTSILKNCLQSGGEATVGCQSRETNMVDRKNSEMPPSVSCSDSSVDLSSIAKMLAATDSNNFQQYLPCHASRQGPAELAPSHHQQKVVDVTMNHPSEAEDFMMDQEDNLVIVESFDTRYLEGDNPENGEEGDTDELLKLSRSGKLESRQTCPYCQRKFPWVSSLRRHLITHTGLKPYECPHCGATFSTKSNCERHINRRHQGQKEGEVDEHELQKDPFKCNECNKVAFSTRRKLQKHYKEDHPLVPFPKEYMEAPDVIVNNKDLIEKIQQGYDPVLSPSVSGIIPEGTKKRNQLFYGNQSPVKEEPVDQSFEGKYNDDASSIQTNGSLFDHQVGEEILETTSFHAHPDVDDASPFLVKQENGLSCNYSNVFEKMDPLPALAEGAEGPNSSPSEETFSDKITSEDDDAAENSDSDSHVSSWENETPASLVGDFTGATSLVIPQVTPIAKKGKKGARFNCDLCCKRFKTEQTLCRHLKVHQLEHPFKCTDCSATFTTKFNCQRHIMKLHGKSKDEVTLVAGCNSGSEGKVSETSPERVPAESRPSSPKKVKLEASSSHVLCPLTTLVKILPKKSLSHAAAAAFSSTKKKKKWNQKIKNILPKLVDTSGVGQDIKAQQIVEFANGQFQKAETVNRDVGEDDDVGWKYSCAETVSSPDVDSNFVKSASEVAGESISNSDIIKDLLGIQDSSTMDQLLESADSAAKILGVQG